MDFDFDIFQIYRQYCDITSGMPGDEGECHSPDDESEKVRFSREALGQLLKTVVSKVSSRYNHFRAKQQNKCRPVMLIGFMLVSGSYHMHDFQIYVIEIVRWLLISVLEEVYKLMTGLDLMTDFKEFSRFYDFVFFVCRENGQRNITVSRAVMAWRLVLAGRFRLLNQWCSFVEENQRHNISEDTWRQVLAFSRCVHENLEGYDPDGAWPILIDDFVEHMYRITGTHGAPSLFCSCGDSESQQLEDTLSGLRILPGSKRKMSSSMLMEEETSDAFTASCNMKGFKRRQLHSTERSIDWRQNLLGDAKDECVEEMKHQTPVGCTKSTCAVERCLSKGFAGLFSSGRSFLRL